MENEFKQVMSERTDEELIKIVTVERKRYNPIALKSANSEIENRNLDINTFEKLIEKETIEKQQKQKVDSNVVGSGIRLLDYIIDFIVAYLLVIVFFIILGIFITSSDDDILAAFLTFIIAFGTFLSYYAFMEIKFQKTVGKFITKTKVVKMNGTKPSTSEIITRTLYRLIPFDGISYLFVKNGLHDYLSKTKVIKDRTK